MYRTLWKYFISECARKYCLISDYTIYKLHFHIWLNGGKWPYYINCNTTNTTSKFVLVSLPEFRVCILHQAPSSKALTVLPYLFRLWKNVGTWVDSPRTGCFCSLSLNHLGGFFVRDDVLSACKGNATTSALKVNTHTKRAKKWRTVELMA